MGTATSSVCDNGAITAVKLTDEKTSTPKVSQDAAIVLADGNPQVRVSEVTALILIDADPKDEGRNGTAS